MDTWTFVWLMFALKIPIVALLLLVRWAIRQAPEEEATGGQGGIGPVPRPVHPHHPSSRRPRLPRHRGPHGERPLLPPARVRTAVARGRLTKR